MAKQTGELRIEGTLEDLTFYKMDGAYYVRIKSSLTGKTFWKSKAFERSRKSCKRFREGNGLASSLYKRIEKEKRVYKLFCFLKKKAIGLLKEGKSLREAEEVLLDYLEAFGLLERRETLSEMVVKKEKKRSCLKTKPADPLPKGLQSHNLILGHFRNPLYSSVSTHQNKSLHAYLCSISGEG